MLNTLQQVVRGSALWCSVALTAACGTPDGSASAIEDDRSDAEAHEGAEGPVHTSVRLAKANPEWARRLESPDARWSRTARGLETVPGQNALALRAPQRFDEELAIELDAEHHVSIVAEVCTGIDGGNRRSSRRLPRCLSGRRCHRRGRSELPRALSAAR